MTLNIDVGNERGVTVVTLSGVIDGNTAPEAQARILPLMESQPSVVLDMTEVEYLSSAGLRTLLLLYRQAASHDGRVAIAGLRESIKDTMAVTGFLNFFLVHDDVAAAVNAISMG
jgi:anti-sigma B factor antagonist